MRVLYKMRIEYSRQPWYNKEIYELINFHKDRYISCFGHDCEWKNIKTDEVINIWDRCMESIQVDECKSIIRELNLNKLGI